MGVAFGRYEIIRRLATGGMAEIFLARERRIEGFERPVVIKKVLPQLAQDKDLTQMFLQEARTAALLEHPNIVRIYDLGNEKGIFYIAMEYIHGETISEIWKRGVQVKKLLPLPYTLQLIADAAKGLDYAHKKRDLTGKPLGIVHRDVSPQNVMVSLEGIVKIVDFGIAKAANKIQKTHAGIIKGKFAYMSPEQARGESVDARSDIFALGILLYELTTGKRLFRAPTDVQTIQKVASCDVIPPSARIPQYPKGLEQIVLKALAPRREERFQEAKDLSFALEEYMRDRRLESRGFVDYLRALFPERLELDLTSSEEDSQSFLLLSGSPSPLVTEGTGGGVAARPGEFVDAAGSAMEVLLEEAASSPSEEKQDSTAPQQEMTGTEALSASPPPPAAPLEKSPPPPALVPPIETPPEEPVRSSRVPKNTGEYLAEQLGIKPKPLIRSGPVMGVALTVLFVAIGGLLTALFWPQISSALGLAAVEVEASLEIRTEPSRALVYLDDVKLKDVTPAKLTGLTAGVPYTIKLVKEGFFPERRTITIDPKVGVYSLDVTLRPVARGTLNVKSSPPGAAISLDGVDTGRRTPAILPVSAEEDHFLLLERQGYLPKEIKVRLKADETREIAETLEQAPSIDLQKTGSLSIVSTEQLLVSLNGKQIATIPPPLVKMVVPAGEHELVLTDKKGRPWSFSISIEVGQELNLSYTMKDGKLVPF